LTRHSKTNVDVTDKTKGTPLIAARLCCREFRGRLAGCRRGWLAHLASRGSRRCAGAVLLFVEQRYCREEALQPGWPTWRLQQFAVPGDSAITDLGAVAVDDSVDWLQRQFAPQSGVAAESIEGV